jgi:acyl transferase domain-containing protein/NADP-dependent 3-hydroxy acid dehydrogenase YdfG
MSVNTDRSAEPLAIIGMACRLPGAENLDQYWQLIVEGRSAIAEASPQRFDQRLYYEPQKGVRGKSYAKLAAMLASREFDPTACPMPPELLQSVDLTHLLMAQVAADALRHAQLDPWRLQPKNTAVFIGHAQGSSQLGELTYRTYVDEAAALLSEVDGFRDLPPAEQAAIQASIVDDVRRRLPDRQANARYLYCNMVAGTIAKAFGLSGAWLALNSACASSLHAMLLGARALQLGRADMVIVGGASDCKSDSLVLFSAAQTLSTCGSRPFDSEADGLVMSEGYVALVMKTLERALADGDPIQAVVRGLGIASDGRGKSLWAPRKEGQMKAMQRAYRSGVDMSKVQYLEAHATSTQVGDATELETLGEVLGPKFPPGKRIPITSVKANIGHALEAAGVAGVIKTVLCMQHKIVPPAINIRTLNTKVDWEKSPYYIPMAPAPWEPQPDGSPRRAAVNAFGIGGMNMHMVLDEFDDSARQLAAGQPPRPAISADDQAVAIVGIGCVLPGAMDVERLWQVLASGTDPKSAPPSGRWSANALAGSNGASGGFVNDFQYDWRKHKVPPKQVAEADPLQFMLLQAAEQALADAGYDLKTMEREKCGVVVGTEFGGEFCDHLEMGLRLPEMQDILSKQLRQRGMPDDNIAAISAQFAENLLRKWPSLVDETGSFTSSTLASRITKTLDLAGGAVSIDSGSTSAFSGLAVAIDMLLSGDNDLMICAAGQRRMGKITFDMLATAGLLAEGQPRNVLDAAYNGIVPAEGVGVVILKRLTDARRDGDRIHTVIRGLALAHGAAPAEALTLAADRSLLIAGIEADQIKLVEVDTDERLTPSSGEINALLGAYAGSNRPQPLVVGSPTGQFGHLGGASGMAALITASLQVERGESVPTVGVQTPSAALNNASCAAKVSYSVETISGRRLGAVAGWSKGLACHLILDEATPTAPVTAKTQLKSVEVAPAASQAAKICRFAGATADELAAAVDVAIAGASVAWSAVGRPFGPTDRFRLAIVADSVDALTRKLKLARPQLNNIAARQVLEQQGIFSRQLPAIRPRVAFVFPGQGSQYDGMLRDLAASFPPAVAALAEGDRTMRALGYPTFAELAWQTPTQLGSDVWSTQVSMFLADAIALAALRSLNVRPDVVLGHSYGEFVALYAAGVWDLETAVRMTRARCEGIVAVARGDSGMLATNAPVDVLEGLMASAGRMLYLANFNAPDQSVVGGKRPQLESLAKALESRSFQARILNVPAAFHTPLMAGGSRLLQNQLQSATLNPPRIPIISTVTNTVVADVSEVRRNLPAQLTTPVRYCQLIVEMAAEEPTVFVEVGPQQTMTRLNRRILDAAAEVVACDNPKRPGIESLLGVQALLECLGAMPAPANTSASSAARSTAQASSPRATEVNRNKPMHDQIPHFDATERRRAKKRGGAAAPSAGSTNGEAHAPAPGATRPAASRPLPAAPQPKPTPKVAPAPAAANPPAARPPLPTNNPKPVPPASRTTAAHGANSIGAVAAQPATPAPKVAAVRAPSAATTAPAANTTPAAKSPPADAKELEKFLINFVVEQTGYPAEVVDLDSDLEADLGVDSIKKAQLFGELQEYFDVGSASAGTLSLDDFPTLRHVMNFLSGLGANAPVAPTTAAQPAAPKPAPAPVPPASANGQAAAPVRAATETRSAAELESFLINFVVEQTGYPAEVVDLDSDLEADLGVDSIKKAQLFGELQEYFDVGSASAGTLSLDDFPTLRHVLNFLLNAGSSAPAATASVAEVERAPVAVAPQVASPHAHSNGHVAPAAVGAAAPTSAAELESFLINFVVEQTGYPPEVVDLDSDLEADLGVDSIKKAQLFGELQEYFDIRNASAGNLSLDDFPTLRHVLDFLLQAGSSAPATSDVNNTVGQSPATSDPAPAVAVTHTLAPAAASTSTVAADTAQLESFLINFVVEQTGYPAEVVDLDSDLEADLGVDSIKKAQLFGELQEYFEVGTAAAGGLSLDDFPTLRHVLDFLVSAGAGEAPARNGSLLAEKATAAADVPAAAALSRWQGTPYEIGWVQGQQFKAEIGRMLRAYADRTDEQLEQLPPTWMGRAPQELLSPDELDELQGMADAAEVPLGNLLAHHFAVWAQLDGGTQLAVEASQNEMGRLVHAAGHPLSADAARSCKLAASLRVPTRGLAHVVVAPLGTVATIGGVNACGIAITAQPSAALPRRMTSGCTCSSVARRVLETAVDVDSAIGVVRSAGNMQPWKACISHAASDRIVHLEFDGRALTVHSAPASLEVASAPAEKGYANGHASTSDATPGHVHLTAAQLVDEWTASGDGIAVAIEPGSQELIYDDEHVSLAELFTTQNAPSEVDVVQHAAAPQLPAAAVTSRFAMEMRDAPLGADVPVEPIWSGSAIVLGDDRLADTLQTRLEQSGLEVHRISPAQDLDTVVVEIERVASSQPAPHLFITSGRQGLPIDPLDDRLWSRRRHESMMVPFFACQKWVELASAGGWLDRSTIVATTSLDGDFGFERGAQTAAGGAVDGLLKALFIEYSIMQKLSGLRVKVVDAPCDADDDLLVADIFRELASDNNNYEVTFVDGRRQVPFAIQRDVDATRGVGIRRGARWVVTGGARGISAACALELGRRFGLRLHLIGSTPAPQIDPTWRNLDDAGLQKLKASVMIAARQSGQPPVQAWERTQKDLEIDRTLQAFAAAGVQATYHVCDVSDRAALAATLDHIRRTDGPIEGILHGAGIDRSCRFERKQRDVVAQTIGAKVDGAAHLMALTRRDPIRHFIGFGSISGRFGSFGQADYCLASDTLCKLIGSYRRQRPWVHAVGFHWHPWDEVGMAARPETKSVLQGKSELHLMPLAEGIAHLVRELATGHGEPEVLITERRHWERFAAGLGTANEVANTEPTKAVDEPEVDSSSDTTDDASAPIELRTYRCQMRTLSAPLPANAPAVPALDGTAWIVGDNPGARALAIRLNALGCATRHIAIGSTIDQTLAEIDRLWAEQPAKHLFLMTGRDVTEGNLLDEANTVARRDAAILTPFFVAQRWYKLLSANADLGRGTLVAAVSLGGDFGFGGKAITPDGGALDGLLKAVHIEDSRRPASRVRAKVVDAPTDEPADSLADSILRELAAAEPEVEVAWTRGQRNVVRPLPADLKAAPRVIPRGGVWVVTGGARGITAIAARELARRYGWKLHLIGKSPAPLADAPWRHYDEAEMKALKSTVARQAVSEGRSPSEAWDRVTKDVEIYNNLRSFADCGVQATYHACDIGDRAALAAVLDQVRRQDGPIQGILHGAGIIDPSRFESKRRDLVTAQVRTKFDGTLHLMSLTKDDPLKFFIGFGSISGRFGGNGLTDYAAGNDALAKVIDWFRTARPDCASACIHWESWEGSGMATVPRYAFGPKAVMNMKYMMPEEGVHRLEQELKTGLSEAEVLYTFGDFYPMFYPHEQRPLGPFVPGESGAATDTVDTTGRLPLVGQVQTAGNASVAQLRLDPVADAFLVQHRLRNKPLLPVVVGLESLAETARGASGLQVVGFRQVQMVDGLQFHTERSTTAQVRATAESDNAYQCELTCDFRNRMGEMVQKDRPYLRALVDVGSALRPLNAQLPSAPESWTDFCYPEGAPVYHGPTLRGVTGIAFDRQGGWGRLVSLPLADLVGQSRVGGWIVPSAVLDAALYACGIHLWMHGDGAVSLPRSIDQLQLGRAPRAGETCLVSFVCREIGKDSACYDFTLIGEDRTVIVAAQGYRKVILLRGGAA